MKMLGLGYIQGYVEGLHTSWGKCLTLAWRGTDGHFKINGDDDDDILGLYSAIHWNLIITMIFRSIVKAVL